MHNYITAHIGNYATLLNALHSTAEYLKIIYIKRRRTVPSLQCESWEKAAARAMHTPTPIMHSMRYIAVIKTRWRQREAFFLPRLVDNHAQASFALKWTVNTDTFFNVINGRRRLHCIKEVVIYKSTIVNLTRWFAGNRKMYINYKHYLMINTTLYYFIHLYSFAWLLISSNIVCRSGQRQGLELVYTWNLIDCYFYLFNLTNKR